MDVDFNSGNFDRGAKDVEGPFEISGEGSMSSTLHLEPKLIDIVVIEPCDDNPVVAWGENQSGQCDVPAGLVAVQVDCGENHSVALRPDGSVVAWGETDYGQCDVPEGLVATQISCGEYHSLALRPDGSVVAWGDNDEGQCDVPAGLVAIQISCGEYHSLALLADGSIVGWGYNDDGQCDSPPWLDAVIIDAGAYHNVAIQADGSVVAWGYNDDGQCDVPAGLFAVDIAGGTYHSMALKDDGSVVAWGDNYAGASEPPTGLVAVQIDAGDSFGIARKEDGSVVAWGYNSGGQVDVPPGLVSTYVATSYWHVLALEVADSMVLYPRGSIDLSTGLEPVEANIAGSGLTYAPPVKMGFDPDAYKFESITISRSIQDMLWSCRGKIDNLGSPNSYKTFVISAKDHNNVPHIIFSGFVPGKDYVVKVASNKSSVQGYDVGFYLTRQFLPDGDLSYPVSLGWSPMGLIKYWLGLETLTPGSPSKWETTTGIRPYRIHNPTTYGHAYTPMNFVFQPTSTKASAIRDVSEASRMVFLVKNNMIDDVLVPCAYFVHEDDIDDPDHGLDLPPIVDITDPDDYLADTVKVSEKSDEKYNRIIVRSSTPAGGWLEHIKQTPDAELGESIPIEYLEERSDFGTIDEVIARAEDLYDYYTKYAFNYTLTLIDRTDLELYQRCRFYGYDYIPEGEAMRIISIRYSMTASHTEVKISVSPDNRLSDSRRMQKSQESDSVSNTISIVDNKIKSDIVGIEVATVETIDHGSGTGTVALERGGVVEVRYIEEP